MLCPCHSTPQYFKRVQTWRTPSREKVCHAISPQLVIALSCFLCFAIALLGIVGKARSPMSIGIYGDLHHSRWGNEISERPRNFEESIQWMQLLISCVFCPPAVVLFVGATTFIRDCLEIADRMQDGQKYLWSLPGPALQCVASSMIKINLVLNTQSWIDGSVLQEYMLLVNRQC